MQINKQVNCALHADKKLEKREREKKGIQMTSD